jgi:CelD/BcsL family acetyltransferase involved in cellulose biosynthesis
VFGDDRHGGGRVSLSIVRVLPGSAAEWDDLWSRCEHATWFQSREWAEVWRASTAGRVTPSPLVAELSDGGRALLPLSVDSRCLGLLRMHLSSPAGTFGGWVPDPARPLGPEHGRVLSGLLAGGLGPVQWRLSPYDPSLRGVPAPAGAVADETHALDLREGFDAVHRRWTKGHTSAARKARREGVEVRAAGSLDDWRDYYRVYEDSLARWGDSTSSRYGWELFAALAECPPSGVRLWLASHGGEIVAGALCLYARRHVTYWHGAALARAFDLRPANLLLHDAIRDACERRLHWFDFNPSGGHEGVVAFKRSFGAQPLPAPVVTIEGARHRFVRRAAAVRRRVLR